MLKGWVKEIIALDIHWHSASKRQYTFTVSKFKEVYILNPARPNYLLHCTRWRLSAPWLFQFSLRKYLSDFNSRHRSSLFFLHQVLKKLLFPLWPGGDWVQELQARGQSRLRHRLNGNPREGNSFHTDLNESGSRVILVQYIYIVQCHIRYLRKKA